MLIVGDMLTIIGFVALPASHDGTATAERVTMTSAGAAEGQPGVIMIVEVGADGEDWAETELAAKMAAAIGRVKNLMTRMFENRFSLPKMLVVI